MESIGASLPEYSLLEGIRAIPMSDIPNTSSRSLFYSADDLARVRKLAEEIKQSRVIKPLIVVQDKEGLYVLEGTHRLAALSMLGIKAFPALIVIDQEEDLGTEDRDNP